jgi:hypothetical protein
LALHLEPSHGGVLGKIGGNRCARDTAADDYDAAF